MSIKRWSPNMMVADMEKTIAFYQDILGFEIAMSVPEQAPFEWASMKSGNIELMFQTRASLAGELPLFDKLDTGGGLTFYIEVDNFDELYQDVKGKVKLIKERETTFYGMEEFCVQDCNGFILTFSQKAS